MKTISATQILDRDLCGACVVGLDGTVLYHNSLFKTLLPSTTVGQLASFNINHNKQGHLFCDVVTLFTSTTLMHPVCIDAEPKSMPAFVNTLISRDTHQAIAVLVTIDSKISTVSNQMVKAEEKKQEQNQLLGDFKSDGLHDSMTGLKNRRYFESFMDIQCDLTNRHENVGSLVIIDIDHFKRVNDTYGHNVGDEVIKEIAGAMKSAARSSDVVCRWGGEEFLIFFQRVNEIQAKTLSNRLREHICFTNFDHIALGLDITISAGVTGLQRGDTAAKVVSRGDCALYRAKNNGRNNVMLYRPE